MNEAKRAQFHLPGLFEFYDFYRVFLPLYRTHREYFYDWCEIASIYGAPEGCLWGGGRVGCGNQDPHAVLALTQEYGLYGAGYWNLMRPFVQNWQVLNALYDIRREG